jgi:hypothetical protein
MDPKVGHFRRMKSYHINHHYKNVELGTFSLLWSLQLGIFASNPNPAISHVCVPVTFVFRIWRVFQTMGPCLLYVIADRYS